MLYTLTSVKDNIRNRDGNRVFYLGKQDRLTSEARDYLTREHIPILPAEEAKPQRYRLPGGGYLEEKPEHMTHLNGDVLVPKTHPRIALRNAMDALQADLLLCQLYCEPPLRKQVGHALQLSRKLLSQEVMDEPVEALLLDGMDDAQLRARSHRPQEFYGQAHFMPEYTDGLQILLLNRCRCAARYAELAAVNAFAGPEGLPTRPDLIRALNRLSSYLYRLMIQEKSK